MITDETRNNLPGNKCGHNAQSPKIYQSPGFYKSRPEILTRAKHRANNVALGRSWHNPQYLKHYKAQRRLDVSLRQQRSEARSRFAQFSGVIYDHLDLETMQLGHWDEKTGMFCPYSWAQMLTILEITQGEAEKFSRDRMYQELRRFVASGYVRIQKRHYDTGEADDNGKAIIRQDVAHKWVCKRIFEDLGISEEQLKKARKIASERNERLRMTAAVAMSANNPMAKPAEAVVMMRESAKNGTYSPVRRYFEQKKAELKLKQASQPAQQAPRKAQGAKLTPSQRAEKVAALVAQGIPQATAENVISKRYPI